MVVLVVAEPSPLMSSVVMVLLMVMLVAADKVSVSVLVVLALVVLEFRMMIALVVVVATMDIALNGDLIGDIAGGCVEGGDVSDI